jgi:penicillin-binding protein-related factor A (putative recombinase)
MPNFGKRFELDFKNSIPSDTYYLRLHDSALGFDIQNSTQRFSLQSPFDCVLFREGRMYALELKSTCNRLISFSGHTPMIKQHQIDELIKAASFGITAGFVVNFRDTEHTYFLPIAQFEFIRQAIGKKSFNEKDIQGLVVEIPSKKLRVNFRYDLSALWR